MACFLRFSVKISKNTDVTSEFHLFLVSGEHTPRHRFAELCKIKKSDTEELKQRLNSHVLQK